MALAQLPFDLDEAKLAAPRIRPAAVEKKEAIARLTGSMMPFATVIAPAGYGKTTLLARWAATDARPFAWVSVDRRDDDAVVFMRAIAAAIHRVEPIPDDVFDALSGPGDAFWTRISHLGNALAALPRPIVLALDDLHAVQNPACLDAVAALFEFVPAGSTIVITSREEPPLPLARWRVQGMLLEIGPRDLRLDQHEADALLRGANVALDEAAVAALTERTEGWAAGLYLAALSLRGGTAGASSASTAERFTGNDRFVARYFRDEVLARLRRDESEFLTRTSVLETMTGPRCDALLGTSGSAKMLAALERSNHFVVPLDRTGDAYRYHHLFRQLLRNELDRAEPQAAEALNSRAMAWSLANSDPEAAVTYGQAAGATEAVASIVDRLALPTYYDGRRETVDEWLRWFSDEDLARFPALAVVGGWVRALIGRAADAEHYLALADGATSTIPLSDGSATIAPWVANLRACMMPHGLDRARADADLALGELAERSGWRTVALAVSGVVHVLRGSIDAARDDLAACVVTGQRDGNYDTVFVALAELALIEAKEGDWSEAGRLVDEARALMQRTGLDGYVTSSIVHVAAARVALHERRHLEARAAMTRAHRLRPMLDRGMPWLTGQVGVELTRAHLALGEVDAARAVLAETVAILQQRPDLGSIVADVRELDQRLTGLSGSDGARSGSLTAAELRLLPYLATHLTFPDIAGRLFITSHTVKSQAKAIYRKLDASSRTEAIDRAVDAGLLEPMFPHRDSIAV
jgi:LuxR family transcriptional regulator, maltose regulon positive regulatory protein